MAPIAGMGAGMANMGGMSAMAMGASDAITATGIVVSFHNSMNSLLLETIAVALRHLVEAGKGA